MVDGLLMRSWLLLSSKTPNELFKRLARGKTLKKLERKCDVLFICKRSEFLENHSHLQALIFDNGALK